MPKHYPGPWVLRTMLFTPGHNEKLIQKALVSETDCLVLDLEDAVPENFKNDSRQVIRKALANKKQANQTILVRINPLESGLTLLDLDEIACRELDGFVFPKAYCADDIKAFDAQLTLKEKMLGLEQGHFIIVILVETPQAVLNCYEMATASARVVGLLFGCEDFLTDMEGFHGPQGRSLLVPRHLIAMAARAADIVPIDTPFVQIHDDKGLEEHILQGRELGYEGILVMTPRQIIIAKRMYTPSEKEIEESRQMLTDASVAAESSQGIAISGNRFISPPTLKRAKKILNRYQAIKVFESYSHQAKDVYKVANRLRLVKEKQSKQPVQ